VKLRYRLRSNRKGAQLIEEALLLSVALVALSLLVGGIESILKQSSTYTSNVWNSITNSLNNIFGSLFHW
jgi:Flp pilus assembly pilin Flp